MSQPHTARAAKHPAPWQVVIDGNGAFVIDKDRKVIVALSHKDTDQIAFWHRIVDAVNAKEDGK